MPEGSAQEQRYIRPKIVFPHASLIDVLVVSRVVKSKFVSDVELTLFDGSKDQRTYEFVDLHEFRANLEMLDSQLVIRGLSFIDGDIQAGGVYSRKYKRLCPKHGDTMRVRMMGINVIHECSECTREVEEHKRKIRHQTD